jgi:hypothetical protein
MRLSSRSPSPHAAARLAWPISAFVATTLIVSQVAFAVDNFNPPVVTKTIQQGQSADQAKNLHLDQLPGKADIVVAIDTTGSMGGAIAQAKTDSSGMVTQIQTAIPGARFALVDFKDYPAVVNTSAMPVAGFGGPGDYPYKLDLPLTGGPTAAATFSTAVGLLSASGGGDGPESYNRAFFEAVNDLALVYDPGALKFLVVLGDNIPHDAVQATTYPACPNTAPLTDPGRDSIMGNADDLPTLRVITGLAAANDTLFMISYGGTFSLSCYTQLAAATGGTAVAGGGGATLGNQIIAAIQAKSSKITKVDLKVTNLAGTGPCLFNVTFTPPNPPSYGPYTVPAAGLDIAFTEHIMVPTTLAPGNYSCTVTAVVDGVERARETINITVTPAAPVCKPDEEDKGHGDVKDEKGGDGGHFDEDECDKDHEFKHDDDKENKHFKSKSHTTPTFDASAPIATTVGRGELNGTDVWYTFVAKDLGVGPANKVFSLTLTDMSTGSVLYSRTGTLSSGDITVRHR